MGFDGSAGLECHGATVSSDGGVLPYRDVDDALGLTAMAGVAARWAQRDQHSLVAKGIAAAIRPQSCAGDDDLNSAERLPVDPVLRQAVGGKAIAKEAESTGDMGRFETEVLTQPKHLLALLELSGKWIGLAQQRR